MTIPTPPGAGDWMREGAQKARDNEAHMRAMEMQQRQLDEARRQTKTQEEIADLLRRRGEQ